MNGVIQIGHFKGETFEEEEKRKQSLPPENADTKAREAAALEAERIRALNEQRTRREAEHAARLAAMPRPLEMLPYARQQELRDSLTAEFSGRLDGMAAVAMASALTSDLHDVQGVPMLRVMHPANEYDRDPTVDEGAEFLATRAEFHPVADAVALLLSEASPAREIDRRRVCFAEVQRLHDLAQAKLRRQREQRTALRAAIAERREFYSAARTERTIIELAERVRSDGDLAKRMKDPAALLIELARSLYQAPHVTDVDPSALAIEVLGMNPLPEIEK